MTTIFLGADWHIDRRIWKSRRDMDGDTYQALDRMRQAVLSHPAEHKAVILAGDIFNTRKVDGLSLMHVTKFIEDLLDADITTFFIQGNHDLDSLSALEVQGAIPLHKQLVEIGDKRVYGLDWMPREELKRTIQEEVPECDLLVLHCMFTHLVTFTNAADLELEDIPGHVGNVLVGDVHVRDIGMLPNGGFCCSPGPLHPCNIEQHGPHGMYVWGADRLGGGDRLVINTRPITRFKVPESVEDAEEYLSSIRDSLLAQSLIPTEEGLEPIIEIKTPTAHTARVEALEQEFKGRFRFFIKRNNTGKILSNQELADAREGMGQMTLLGGLSAFVSIEEEPEVYTLLDELLSTPDSGDVIRNIVRGVLDAAT